MIHKMAERREGDSGAVPHVSLRVLRNALGLSIESVCAFIAEDTGVQPDRSTISKIETGRRGASVEMIEALAAVYGIDPTAIDTHYVPRHCPTVGGTR